jgi:ATP-binding cassette subfamily B protein
VEAAARAAEAHRFITELPDGYDTVVGERGLTLSGGQRQRVALARALLSDPSILILDDATSAVDAKVEADIQATLRRVMHGRTTLIVAHRRSTLRLADRIAVVDHGRVLDQGTHTELMARSEVYRRLLGGPSDDIDELGVESGASAVASRSGGADSAESELGITPELWPYERGAGEDEMTGARPARAGLGAGLRGMGGGGGGGGGNWMGAIGPTPELLEQVAALAPAEDRPDVDVAAEAADDPGFSLRRFVRPYRRPLAAGLALVVLDAVATLAGPLLIRDGLDQGVARGSATALWVASIVFLVVVADWVDSTFQVLVTGRTAERMLFALRVKIWAHLQRLSIDYYEREMAGRIMTRMTTDVDALSNLLNSGLINAIVSLFTIVGVGVAMLAWNAELGLIALSVVLPLAAATVAYRRLSARAYERARERIAVVNANMQESLSGVRESQAFRREERNQEEFRVLSGRYLDARLSAQRLVALYFPFVELLADVAAVLVLGVGSVLIAGRSLTAGELVGFLLYLDLFFNPIQQLSQTFDAYQQAGASMAQINSLMGVRPLVTSPAAPVEPRAIEGRVELVGVSFAYPGTDPGRLALRDVNLEIPAGQSVALVGETGAGKSTVVKLLTRFYDPMVGEVAVDGYDLRRLDLEGYRHHIGYVPQEAHLFSGTIRDNIAYGRPDASDSEVEAAARAVGAHEVIAGLSDGYLHWVTERGRSLSVGQRQLIALARAQLVDPAILLLDEATSNLDLATEAQVARAMGLVASGRTTVLIAHRLQTARQADRIVVMDAGRVVEDGTHEELVAIGGRYAEMWEAFADAEPAVELAK